jgi:phosphatidylinositol alpha-1,6-mannosyltransferase
MLNNEFPPLGGGTGTVNRELLQCFSHLTNLEIILITSALGKQYEEESFAERIHIYKVPVNNQIIHHSSNKELLTYAARTLPLALKLQKEKYFNLCLAWSTVPAGAIAWVLWRLMGLEYLVRVSGPDIPGFESRYRFIYPFLTPVVRGVWRDAKTVIAKCESEARMIQRVDRSANFRIIPNGVDLDRFRPGESIRDDGPLRILCVARLIERKGQFQLIEAVKKLLDDHVDVRLDLVGTGDAEGAYRAQVQKLGIERWVRFLGYVPRERIHRFYADAHVFVLPSYNEAMSVAMLEAMAAGLPVVVTDSSGSDELVKAGWNGFRFGWGDVNTLASHLYRFANDRDLVRRMSLESHRHVEKFSWQTVSASYLELVERASN